MSAVKETDLVESVILPRHLVAEVERVRHISGATLEAFVAEAIADKLASMQQASYLAARAARSVPGRGRQLLQKAGSDGPVASGDEIP
jgi:hypothetical protein